MRGDEWLHAVSLVLQQINKEERSHARTNSGGSACRSDDGIRGNCPGTARHYRRRGERWFRRRPPGRHGRSPQLGQRRAHDRHRPARLVSLPVGAAGHVRNHRQPGELQALQGVERRRGAWLDQVRRLLPGDREPDRGSDGHRGIADRRREIERARRQHPCRADRAPAAQPGLPVPGRPGARRQPGVQVERHHDRWLLRRREPVHHRRHRNNRPDRWLVGQGPARGFRRRGAGQVHRLSGGIRRVDGWRHQRPDQERDEQLERRPARPLPGLETTGLAQPHAACGLRRSHPGRVPHVREGREQPV